MSDCPECGADDWTDCALGRRCPLRAASQATRRTESRVSRNQRRRAQRPTPMTAAAARRERLLEALRARSGPCPAAALAAELGAPVSFVYRGVHRLRRDGWRISGDPGVGFLFAGRTKRSRSGASGDAETKGEGRDG